MILQKTDAQLSWELLEEYMLLATCHAFAIPSQLLKGADERTTIIPSPANARSSQNSYQATAQSSTAEPTREGEIGATATGESPNRAGGNA